MGANAPETPVQAEVIFLVEATALNGAFINELKTNYIVPTLEYFHGGTLDEGSGSGSVYAVVTYKSADCHPGVPVETFGPFTNPQLVVDTVDKIEFVGGHAELRACLTEGLTMALACFEELARTDIPRHVLIACCSPPYTAYAGGLLPPGAPSTVEQAARAAAERGVQVSLACARRVPAYCALFDARADQQPRNYAKDPKHLVLLNGYSLKERVPSPTPELTDVYGQGRGQVAGVGAAPAGAVAGPAGAAGVARGAGGFPRGGGAGRGAWLAPPRPALCGNSALLTQLAQPSYPPAPPSMLPPIPAQQQSAAGLQRMPAAGAAPGPPAPQRTYIWSGILEWMEKGKGPQDHQKLTKHLPCQVSANSKDIEPELKVDTWPNKLLMQLMPKQLISNIGGQYLKDSKSVLFHLQPNEALDALTKVMVNGFAGCVHFSPMSSPPQCDIKVLILLYTPDKKAYLGFIPNNQATFVDRLRKVIQQQKITQIINKQMPSGSGIGAMPTPSMPGQSSMPGQAMPGQSTMPQSMGGQQGMSVGGQQGMSVGGQLGGLPGLPGVNQQQMQPGQMQPGQMQPGQMQPGQMQPGQMQPGQMQPGQMQPGQMQQGQMQPGQMQPGQMQQGQMQPGQMQQGQMQPGQMQQHQQSMMVGGGMGKQGGRSVAQLDGLEAARQQNLEKIQQLQQTLEAAHQQEAQFKSQMDIMSHLHAAQQQEQHYKQLEEQQRKQHQLQAQLQQQLQRPGAGVPPRIMRPMMPSNPGLRHLLQQQPQYRPGGVAPRPASQPQQFDDVSSYNDFL